LATFAAIRRASSLVSSLAGDRRPAPLAPPEMRGLFTGLRSFGVLAQESVMEFAAM
jgi:hypothetical protein